MTPQEIFDKAYLGITGQGEASVNQDSHCIYLTPKGTQCGVGILLDKDLCRKMDDAERDGTGIGSFATDPVFGPLLPDWIAPNITLLTGIQYAHDSAAIIAFNGSNFVEAYQDEMSRVATANTLTIPVIPQ